MNKYQELKESQSKRINSFPMFFAFTKSSSADGMKKFGLKETETDKIVSIGSGGYIKKESVQDFKDMINSFENERQEAIKADTTGEGFIYDMFLYELRNHEYCYTGTVEDTLDALGMTFEEIEKDKALLNGLVLAKKEAAKDECF